MVVSVGKCADARYYTDSVAAGRESYYLDAVTEGEPAGQWSGRLAEQVGLAGEVQPDDMHTLFSTFCAPDGTQLGRGVPQYRSVEDRLAQALEAEPGALPERVAQLRSQIETSHRQACLGWDLTASAPKSVTVAHTAVHRAELEAIRFGDRESAAEYARVRTGIEAAILDANAEAIEYAATLSTARAGRHGATGELPRWEAAPDLAVASFFQHTSRSIQPQLHVHNVVLNRAGCVDGQIRALDGVDLLAQRQAIGAVFDLSLATRLDRLGLQVRTRADGKARELTAVDADACELFSERRRVIAAALQPAVDQAEQHLGRSLTDQELSRLRSDLTLKTRQGKTHDGESLGERLSRWQAELTVDTGRGLDPIARRVLDQTAGGGSSHPVEQAAPTEVGWSPVAVLQEAVAAIAEARPTWGRGDLLAEISRRLPTLDDIRPGQVKELVDALTEQALASDHVHQVTQVPRPVPAGLTGWASRPSDARYAAAGTLAAEEAVRQGAVVRGSHHLEHAEVEAWLDAAAPEMGADQRAAVVGLASSDAAMAVLVGPAGTGKSFTAGALAGVWGERSDGGRVVGLATSQTAAEVLAADGLPVTANLTAFRLAQHRLADTPAGSGQSYDEDLRIGPRDLVLIDEASMVSTADLHVVQDAVDAAGARMVLTGDPQQLGAVGAGGVMGLLAGDRAETYTLSDVRRFSTDWEAAASLQLRAGGDDATEALAEYDQHGRIIDCPDLDAAVASAARGVVADRLDGRTTLAVADSNALAARVAVRVRDLLIEHGAITPAQAAETVELGRDQVTAGVGDEIEFRRIDRGVGVLNRGHATITAVHGDGALSARLPDGREVRLPAGYVEADVSLGYCTTIYGAQGATVDTGHLVTAGGGDAASLYVGMSRGGDRNTAHVALHIEGADRPDGQPQAEAAGQIPAPTGAAVLAGVSTRSGLDDAATVTAEADAARRASAATIGAEYEDAVRQVCRARMERHLDSLTATGILHPDDRAKLAADQSAEHLSRLLRAVEQAGHDPRTALRAAIEDRRGFSDAGSIGQVLSSRITAAVAGPGAVPAPQIGAATGHGRDLPAGIPSAHAEHLAQLRADLDTRARILGAQVADEQPAWAVHVLGPVPDEQVERLGWEDRAGRVAVHREATGWSEPDRALDASPGISATERRASWWAAQEALGDGHVRDEAAMSDGQLRVRITAWKREQAWAPPHADTALRAAELDAERAHQDAVLSAAQTDPPPPAADTTTAEPESHGPEAERAGRRRVLDAAARIRAEWAAHTAVTRANAERAGEEAERRGLDIDREPDRMTAEQYLGQHQDHERGNERSDAREDRRADERADERTQQLLAADRAARRADDEHRSITESDITDRATERTRHQARQLFAADQRSPSLDHPPLTRTAGAHATVNERPTEIEMTSAAAAARSAGAVLADRASHDRTEPGSESLLDQAAQSSAAARHRTQATHAGGTDTGDSGAGRD